MELVSDLSFRFPLMRGAQVRAIQLALQRQNLLSGPADGIFGPGTGKAIRAFQEQSHLQIDGVVGKNTWNALFQPTADTAPITAMAGAVSWREKLQPYLNRIKDEHASPLGGDCKWKLTKQGVLITGQDLPRTKGDPTTASATWQNYRESFEKSACAYGVPVELLIATACTESGGDADAIRKEPGYISDEETPNRISPGLMQTLISTARAAMGDNAINRQQLLTADTAIRAGAAYIKQQAVRTNLGTNFDPPLVGIAYNAGSLRHAANNPWGLVQTDRGNGKFHADAYVEYFNDTFAVLSTQPPAQNTPSYWSLLNT
jgi:hypothetical protein